MESSHAKWPNPLAHRKFREKITLGGISGACALFSPTGKKNLI
jgi:hypothetical protein